MRSIRINKIPTFVWSLISIFWLGWLGWLGYSSFQISKEYNQIEVNLLEADRRSSLVFEMSNVLDQVDEEISVQKNSISKENGSILDSARFSLSKPLIGRIVALSRAFRPYRILENDTLSNEFTSPERGYLIVALLENNLDDETQKAINQNGDFSYAEIINLEKSGLNLRKARLANANLSGANLSDSDLSRASLFNADLTNSDLSYVNFNGTDLGGANIKGSSLLGANLVLADLSYASLQNSDLKFVDFSDANLSFAFLGGVKGLTLEQLKNVRSLYGCRNLDPDLGKGLRLEKPCLFTENGCY